MCELAVGTLGKLSLESRQDVENTHVLVVLPQVIRVSQALRLAFELVQLVLVLVRVWLLLLPLVWEIAACGFVLVQLPGHMYGVD